MAIISCHALLTNVLIQLLKYEFGFLKDFSEFCCEILVRRDIDFDFGVEYFLQAWRFTFEGNRRDWQRNF